MKYTILKNWHYSIFNPFKHKWVKFNCNEVRFKFILPKNAWYAKENEDNAEWNILYGVSYGFFGIHNNSMRFAWRPDFEVKYKKKYSSNRYEWKEYISPSKKKEIRLYDVALSQFVIKNSRTAGTEKWLVINGQKYYSGLYHDYEKGNILDAINAHYYSFLQGLEPIINYPLYIECEIHDLAIDPISGNQKWDVFNRAFPYCKAFEDNLKKHNIIPDDNTDYILVPSHGIFFYFFFHEIESFICNTI